MARKQKLNLADLYGERSTKLTMNAKSIPPTPAGKEIVIPDLVGRTVQMSELCPYRGQAITTGYYMQNGFARYEATVGKAKVILRQCDIDWNFEYEAKCEMEKRKLRKEVKKCR